MRFVLLLAVVLICAAVYGYFANVIKIFYCDFEAPYKCEAVRIGGAIVPPLGFVVGYMDIGE